MPTYQTVVEPRTLRTHLNDPSWVVVDCRHSLQDFEAGERAYLIGHIPGAYFVSVENDLSGPKTGKNGRHPLPDPNAFAGVLRSMGVTPQTQIVAYDAGADMFAARFWFLCRWVGHDAIALLDGGFAAWVEAGYPTTSEPRRRLPLHSVATLGRSELTLNADDVAHSLRDSKSRLLDARSPERYAGLNESIDPVAGHIPSAENRFFKDNFDASGRFKSPDELRSAFAAFGAPRDVVHYCGSGVSAAVNMFAMERAGLSGSRIYPGSWSEWVADPSRPVAAGSKPR